MAEEMEKPSEAMLATLTPEERAAIEEDDLSPTEKAALEELAGDDDGDDDDDESGNDDDGKVDDAAAAKDDEAKGDAKAGESAEAATADDDEDDDEPAQKFAPRYKVELPEDFADQVKALDKSELALAKKFKAGEMEAEEFIAEQKALAGKRGALQKLQDKAETFEELNKQSAEQEWQHSIHTFMRKVKKVDGIDYQKDTEKQADFDTFVKALAAKPENANKDYDWFLSTAHKRVKVLHGIADKVETKGKEEGKADAKPDAKAAAKAARKPNLAAIPKTLAHVPGGDGPGDVNDEFVELDKLDGIEYEQALARMTPAQREKYLKAA